MLAPHAVDIAVIISSLIASLRLLARILKVGVQIFCGPKAHIAWRPRCHASRGVGGSGGMPPPTQKILKN